ncbi:MAG: hypothetical protein AAFN81_31320, partial [Bacteroidota bacterium]
MIKRRLDGWVRSCYVVLLISGSMIGLYGQTSDSIPPVDYQEPQDYEIGGITVSGAYFSDEVTLVSIT